MSIATRWWWIRHAPVPDGGRIYGQRDLSCDCSDAEIFAILAGELPAGAVWVTSNLVRTKETAAAILAADPVKFAGVEPRAVPELAEQHLGQWQGLDRKAFYAARQVGTHTLWFAPADERPPGGESFADLVRRVAPAIEALAFATENCSLTRLDHLSAAGGAGLWRVVAANRRPWSRTPAAQHLGHNPVAIDKA